MKRLVLLLLPLLAGQVLAADPEFIEDCGLEPPGSYVPTPTPTKPFELPAIPGEPALVRRELKGPAPGSFLGVPSARLRSGALTGKTIYVSAGHGFVYTDTLTSWRTQRGSTQGIVEDLVSIETIDQFLVPMLLNAGANVVTVRESDINTDMVVVDDLSPGYSESGTATLFADSSLPGWGAPPNPMNGAVLPFSLAKNRLLEVSAAGTASATWAPDIPADGFYNVYISYSAFTARTNSAHYVVKHAGGEAHFRVNQQRHGGTWVLLGRFYFRAGQHPASASVVAMNDSANGVNLSLDAVRFGGGMGSVKRGPAAATEVVSGRPRFEESCRPYAQFAGAPASVFAPTGVDRNDDISCRSKFSAWAHEPGEDAVYIAWHTNAFNSSAVGTDFYVYGPNPPDGNYTFTGVAGSDTLAQSLHAEMINDIQQGWGPTTWRDRGIHTAYFGEINPTHNPEMPSLLMEVAFHDAPSDAAQLKEPGFRYLASRSITQGLIKWFAAKDATTATLPPEPPTGVSAVNKGAGAVELRWKAPATDTLGVRGQAATKYQVYGSDDGLAWDDGVEVTGTTHALTLPAGTVRYFRVAGVNAGGESFPSELVGVGVSATAPAPVLVVNAYDRLEAALGYTETFAGRYGLSPALRIFLERMNDGTYARQHGEAVAWAGVAFDGATADAVTGGDVALAAYPVVDWFAGRGHAQAAPPSAAEMAALTSYLGSGKGLLFSGSHAASGLAAGAASSQTFLAQVLHASSATGGGTLTVDGEAAGFLTGMAGLSLDDGKLGTYPTGTSDALGAGGFSIARYAGTTRPAAVAWSGAGKVVFLGFPFETLVSRNQRLETMGRILKFFEVITVEPPLPDAGTPVDAGIVDAGIPEPIVLGPMPDSYEYALKGGCGCGAAGGALPALLGLLAAILRARRRR
ncbi:MAG: golvesin C-terminal-like domain-containing protein [Myxococcaceae bacterium]